MEKILRSKEVGIKYDSVIYNITEKNVLHQTTKHVHSVPEVNKLTEEIIKKVWAAIHGESVEA